MTQRFNQAEATIDWLLETVGNDLRVGAPLGLGKPATLLNALYQRAKANPAIQLTLITALSLDVPVASSELERRLMDPIVDRVFEDYLGLDYLRDLKADALPDNVTISEFFFVPGSLLENQHAQRHYRSVNYTHVARDLIDADVNVLMQMGAPGPTPEQFSLSSNADVTLDLMPAVQAAREAGDTLVVVGQINTRMPMMTRSALVDADWVDAIFEGEAADFKPFGAPSMPVSEADYAIGLRVSTLLADGGTLQIGIGSLSDAIAYCCDLRENANADYRYLVERLRSPAHEQALIDAIGGLEPFERGLYGCTEMLVDAYLHMYRAGVVKRVVYDDIALQELIDAETIGAEVTPDTLAALWHADAINTQLTAGNVAYLKRFGVFHDGVQWDRDQLDAGDGSAQIPANLDDDSTRAEIEKRCLGNCLKGATLIHGGFFLGPNAFYERLRTLDDRERDLVHMTGISQINQLYGGEALRRVQRKQARFVNTAIKATLSGAIASDGLEDGRVLSGVGGQYNFVAQAQELEGGRSILCLRAVRDAHGKPASNIVAHYAHTTIPRHLRDIVVTEYGVADLRGKSDEQVAIAMIEIADARFQDELRSAAIAAGKLSPAYRIPEHARANTPDRVHDLFAPEKRESRFPRYPYGSDFTDIELTLIGALKKLQGLSAGALIGRLARHASILASIPRTAAPYLERMDLTSPRTWRESLYARIVTLALLDDGAISANSDDHEHHDYGA